MREPYKKYVKVILNLLTAVAVLLAAVFLLPRIVGFFMPFVIGWIISMIANPLVRFLDEKLKIRRKAGSAIVIITVIALIILVGYWGISILVREGTDFVLELPELWGSLQADLNHAGQAVGSYVRYFPPHLQSLANNLSETVNDFLSGVAGHLSSPTVSAVGNIARNIPSVFVGLIMCLLSAYFFVAQRDEVIRAFHRYVPAGLRQKWLLMYGSMVEAAGGYFKAQFKIEFWMYFLLLIGFLILGVNHAAFIALGIALLDFFPVFGTGTVLIPWAVIRILGGGYKMAVGLLIIWCVGQLARQLIQPKIMGDSMGIPALPTLVLLYIGYRLGSVGGMILAVPIGIILVKMYQAGFFETTVDSLRILIHGFNSFRRLTEEDKKENDDEGSGL